MLWDIMGFMVIEMTFRRSVETISRYFHEVLYAVSEFHNKMIVAEIVAGRW
jgi:hypothetical protein